MSNAINNSITNAPKPKKKKSGKVPQKNLQQISKAIQNDRLIYRVPECSENYFHSLVDPFSVPSGVCIPCDLFPIPSQKCKTFVRGTFNLGTSGIGFFGINPTTCNNVVCTVFSTTLSVGTAATAFNAFTNTGGTFMSQLPYDTTAFPAVGVGLRARIVAFGVRIKYVGKLMDTNGVAASYEDPDTTDILGLSWNNLNSLPYTTLDRVSTFPHWDKSVCYSGPTTTAHIEYALASQPFGAVAWVIGVSGLPNDLYEYEFYQHTEYIGKVVVGKTMSHAEPITYGKILETTKDATTDRPLEPYMAPTLWERFKSKVSESLPSFVQGGFAVVKSVMEMNPSKLYEGYRGIEKGFNSLSLDYGPQVKDKMKLLPAPKPPHFVVDRRIPVVMPSHVEVVDELPSREDRDFMERLRKDPTIRPLR